MEKRNPIYDLDFPEVEYMLDNVLLLAEGIIKKDKFPYKNTYFIGQGLCVDLDGDVVTFSHSSECVGYFSGGIRRLVSIKGMKTLEKIMSICNINFEPKFDY